MSKMLQPPAPHPMGAAATHTPSLLAKNYRARREIMWTAIAILTRKVTLKNTGRTELFVSFLPTSFEEPKWRKALPAWEGEKELNPSIRPTVKKNVSPLPLSQDLICKSNIRAPPLGPPTPPVPTLCCFAFHISKIRK